MGCRLIGELNGLGTSLFDRPKTTAANGSHQARPQSRTFVGSHRADFLVEECQPGFAATVRCVPSAGGANLLTGTFMLIEDSERSFRL
jgi:hypothetical protein